jgi:hypothetical protein
MVMDPRQPTTFPAGSEEKVAVMIERAKLELPLFLEGDSPEVAWRAPKVQAFVDAFLIGPNRASRAERWAARQRVSCARYRQRRKAREKALR